MIIDGLVVKVSVKKADKHFSMLFAGFFLKPSSFGRRSHFPKWIYLLFFIPALAIFQAKANAAGLTYHGRILKPDGQPLLSSNVEFTVLIKSPSNSSPDAGCVLYQEVQSLDMTGSAGAFALELGTKHGAGAAIVNYVDGSTANLEKVFSNKGTISGYSCSYTPGIKDARQIVVKFRDVAGGGTDQFIEAQPVTYVPFAFESHQVSGFKAENLLRVDDPTPINALSLAEYQKILGLVGGTAGGAVRVGTESTTCGAPIAGAIRYNSGVLEFCNATSWTPLAASGSSITSLNGLTTGVQTFTIGSAGLAPAFSSAGGTHTLNLPLASGAGVTAGLLSKTDYDAFNAKVGTATSFSGDVSGAYNSTSVDKIKGKPVAAATTAGQFMVYDSASWVNVTMSGDATMAANGSVTLKNTGTTGTYTKVTTDAQGRVTSGTTLVASDIPGLDWAKITSGLPTTLSGYGITDAIQNAGGTPSVQTGTLAARPAVGTAGRLYISSDDNTLWRDTGAAWVKIGDGAGSGTVTSVTSSNSDISVATTTTTPVLTLNAGTTGGAGDANKIAKFDASGLLTPAMIPSLDVTKLGAGILPIARGGTNSGTALNNNRVMVSSGGAIVESSAITATRALASDANGIPVASTVTAIELGYLSGVTSALQTQLNGKAASTGWANFSVIGTDGSGTLAAVTGSVNGSVLQYSATGPIYSTASFPGTTTVNQLLYSSADNVVGGLATANNAVLTTNGSGVPAWSPLANDFLAQYALLAGRSGGQTLNGGNAASENLTLDSTSNGTKGDVIINPTAGDVGIGTPTPNFPLEISRSGNDAEIGLSSYGGAGSGLYGRRSGGSSGAPTAVSANQTLLYVGGRGHNGTSFTTSSSSLVEFRASENWSTSGTGAAIRFFSTLNGTTTASERMRIENTGNVGIGTTAPGSNTKLSVEGQIRSKSGSTTTGAIDFANGNAITTSFDCSANVTFANLRDGGAYTLAVTNSSTTQCNFSTATSGDDAATVTYRFQPANGVRTASSHTIYSLQRIGNIVYVSWITGF